VKDEPGDLLTAGGGMSSPSNECRSDCQDWRPTYDGPRGGREGGARWRPSGTSCALTRAGPRRPTHKAMKLRASHRDATEAEVDDMSATDDDDEAPTLASGHDAAVRYLLKECVQRGEERGLSPGGSGHLAWPAG
jgi:hypothetical protein